MGGWWRFSGELASSVEFLVTKYILSGRIYHLIGIGTTPKKIVHLYQDLGK